MNSLDLERCKKERKHVLPPNAREHFTCWCGLCHCDKCADARADMPHQKKGVP